jgi:protein-L-isoaspartate O-methyltransferase
MVLGRMIQALGIEAGERVLDVACGRGYSAAVLAELGAQVTALETDESLAQTAKECLAAAGANNVTVKHGPLDQGSAENAPYDAILVNGAVEVRPEGLLRQLAEGGRLICVKGRGRAARATLYVRSGDTFGERGRSTRLPPCSLPSRPSPASRSEGAAGVAFLRHPPIIATNRRRGDCRLLPHGYCFALSRDRLENLQVGLRDLRASRRAGGRERKSVP